MCYVLFYASIQLRVLSLNTFPQQYKDIYISKIAKLQMRTAFG